MSPFQKNTYHRIKATIAKEIEKENHANYKRISSGYHLFNFSPLSDKDHMNQTNPIVLKRSIFFNFAIFLSTT